MTKKWYQYLGEELRPLALESLTLLQRERQDPGRFPNYDFVVFPLAKAYEPFLKTFLFQLNLIDERTYNSKKFSIGRALNPDVQLGQRDEAWYYDDLARALGEPVAREVWQTWLVRNRLFHLYPGEVQTTDLETAANMIEQLIKMISILGTSGVT
jgi:hypothetical protein